MVPAAPAEVETFRTPTTTPTGLTLELQDQTTTTLTTGLTVDLQDHTTTMTPLTTGLTLDLQDQTTLTTLTTLRTGLTWLSPQNSRSFCITRLQPVGERWRLPDLQGGAGSYT